jgi:hypothetical protein
MILCEFIQKLHLYICTEMKNYEFVKYLFKNITTVNIDDLFEDKESKYFTRIYSGDERHKLKADYARKMTNNLNLDCFDNIFEECELDSIEKDDTKTRLRDVFAEIIGKPIGLNDLSVELTTLFIFILEAIAGGNNKRTQKQDVPILDTTNITVYDEIKRIIDFIEKINPKDLKKAQKLDLKIIEHKIPNKEDFALVNAIKEDNLFHFNDIRKLLKEKCNSSFIVKFSQMVQEASENRAYLPRQQAFDRLVLWLQEMTSSPSPFACQKIISYFVKHCEVFNENPK